MQFGSIKSNKTGYWSSPVEDFLKFNVDAMARSELGPAGIQTFAITKERC